MNVAQQSSLSSPFFSSLSIKLAMLASVCVLASAFLYLSGMPKNIRGRDQRDNINKQESSSLHVGIMITIAVEGESRGVG